MGWAAAEAIVLLVVLLDAILPQWVQPNFDCYSLSTYVYYVEFHFRGALLRGAPFLNHALKLLTKFRGMLMTLTCSTT